MRSWQALLYSVEEIDTNGIYFLLASSPLANSKVALVPYLISLGFAYSSITLCFSSLPSPASFSVKTGKYVWPVVLTCSVG